MSIINPTKCAASTFVDAKCVSVEDMGVMDTKFGKKPMVRFTFETDQVNEFGQKRRLTRLFHKHFHPMSALSVAAKSWCERVLAVEEESGGVDLQAFVDSSACIKIEPGAEKGGRHYDNIVEILPLKDEEIETTCEPKDNE
jgi:hypothetical protein